MTGTGTSVSRLAVLPLDRLWPIFVAELDRADNPVTSAGEIAVGDVVQLGAANEKPVTLSVVPRPTATNPAHAEIPQQVGRGLALKIIAQLTIHPRPAGV